MHLTSTLAAIGCSLFTVAAASPISSVIETPSDNQNATTTLTSTTILTNDNGDLSISYRRHQLQTRASAGRPAVYVCQHPNWQGPCTWRESRNGECLSIPYFSFDVSFGPDKGVVCMVYNGFNCDVGAAEIAYPGTPNLLNYGEKGTHYEHLGYSTYRCWSNKPVRGS